MQIFSVVNGVARVFLRIDERTREDPRQPLSNSTQQPSAERLKGILNKLLIEEGVAHEVPEPKASRDDHDLFQKYVAPGGVDSGSRATEPEEEGRSGLSVEEDSPGTRLLTLTGPWSSLLLTFNPMAYKFR